MTQTSWVVAGTGIGACIGSFLNVVIHRLQLEDPKDRWLGGRSRCPHCRAPIQWRDNIPLFGWLLLRGKSRCCQRRISPRYPFVEALTAAMFGVLVAVPLLPYDELVVDGAVQTTAIAAIAVRAAFVAILIACTFIDLDCKLLPDALTKPGMALGLAASFFVPGLAGFVGQDDDVSPAFLSFLSSLLGLGTGMGITWTIRFVAGRLFRREAMGLGDVKFLGMIGTFLGWRGTLLALFLACLSGAVVGSVQLLVVARARRAGASAAELQERRMIPFGPFLALGAVIAMFAEDQIMVLLFDSWPEWQRQSPAGSAILVIASILSLIALVVLVRRGRGNG